MVFALFGPEVPRKRFLEFCRLNFWLLHLIARSLLCDVTEFSLRCSHGLYSSILFLFARHHPLTPASIFGLQLSGLLDPLTFGGDEMLFSTPFFLEFSPRLALETFERVIPLCICWSYGLYSIALKAK